MNRALVLASSLAFTSPRSIFSASPSSNGSAVTNKRLCLLGDLLRAGFSPAEVTVSRKDTTGSFLIMGIQAWSSSRSFKQISKCNSPAPATTWSPLSGISQTTIGSDLANRFNPAEIYTYFNIYSFTFPLNFLSSDGSILLLEQKLLHRGTTSGT